MLAPYLSAATSFYEPFAPRFAKSMPSPRVYILITEGISRMRTRGISGSCDGSILQSLLIPLTEHYQHFLSEMVMYPSIALTASAANASGSLQTYPIETAPDPTHLPSPYFCFGAAPIGIYRLSVLISSQQYGEIKFRAQL